MQSPEDYPEMKNWKSSFGMKKYSHGDYHWVEYSGWADPLKVIVPPKKPFRIILTTLAGTSAAALIQENSGTISGTEGIWTKIDDNFIVSSELYQLPKFERKIEMACIGIEKDFSIDFLAKALCKFKDFDYLATDDSFDAFWTAVDEIEVLFYDSCIQRSLFLSRGPELLNQFVDSDEFKNAPDKERDYWKSKGNEK